MADLTEVVAGQIRARRLAHGLTQAALAEQAGVSTELVSRIERARCLPSLPTLVAFASVLHTTPNDLLGFETPTRGGRDLDAIVNVVRRLPSPRRKEIRRIAEALERYDRTRDGE